MFNPLPLAALGVVALGYAGAMQQAEDQFAAETPEVVSFAAANTLSVQNYAAQFPQSADEPYCDTPDMIELTLDHDFAETERESWMQGSQVRLALWASDVMGTWTLVAHTEGGASCIQSSGFGWTTGMTARDVLSATPLAS